MKLSQYKEKKNHKKIIAIALVIIALIGGVILEKTFANFKENKSFKIIEGNFIYEGNNKDITINFYEENKLVEQLSGNYYFDKGKCNNDAMINYNEQTKDITIINLTKTNTLCEVYFDKKSPTREFLENIKQNNSSQLNYDNTIDNNLRFIGTNPYNYLSFNNETWRIIGLMNNIVDEEGITQSHLKIIRNESIDGYSWDSSSESINNGYGVNEWSTSDIAKVLNENYYNKQKGGICYSGRYEQIKECPLWENIGLDSDARTMVSKVKWHMGTIPVDFNTNTELITPSYMYEAEKSNNTGKICSKNDGSCSDDEKRTSTWTGYIGLLNPSDYAYATAIGTPDCFNTSMYNWHTLSKCYNNYLHTSVSFSQWTITPAPNNSSSTQVFEYSSSGRIIQTSAYDGNTNIFYPVLYLNADVKISGVGTSSSPFQISREDI